MWFSLKVVLGLLTAVTVTASNTECIEYSSSSTLWTKKGPQLSASGKEGPKLAASGKEGSQLAASGKDSVLKRWNLEGVAQGTTYKIIYFSAEEVLSVVQTKMLFEEVDRSLSLYQPQSLINQFNAAQREISADLHLMRVVGQALEINRQSAGYFDMTVQPLMEIWGFSALGPRAFPDSATVQKTKRWVGGKMVKMKSGKLIKRKPEVKIDLNGIAQGYTVDLFADWLEKRGVQNYMVEIGGEIRVSGKKSDGTPFVLGIEGPDSAFTPTQLSNQSPWQVPVLKHKITIGKGAVTTSGVYRKYREQGGKLLPHVLNPFTGYPTQSNILSITVIAPKAMLADGWDNALLTMGMEKAITRVNQHGALEAYIVYLKTDGTIADTSSKRFQTFLLK